MFPSVVDLAPLRQYLFPSEANDGRKSGDFSLRMTVNELFFYSLEPMDAEAKSIFTWLCGN